MFWEYAKEELSLKDELIRLCREVEKDLMQEYKKADDTGGCNQIKVLKAMQKNKVSDAHFAATTGYGYNDLGRDTLEQVYADVFHGEAALVRPQLISGTHALTIALSAHLKPGDELLSPVGSPYDTLQSVIGIKPTKGSLIENGVTYKQVDLLLDGQFDWANIAGAINKNTKMVLIQRSKGYQWRKSLLLNEIGELISYIKNIRQDIICLVDNCYGEFVDTLEPGDVGADLTVGSLIKNPGGGLAPVGGYITGKEELIDLCAIRLFAPGLCREAGATLGLNAPFLQGLFMAPQVVAGCVKGAIFAAGLMERLGYGVNPGSKEARSDIVQAIHLGKGQKVLDFCRGVQSAAPVDSFAVPEPWDMPGYDCPVVMAAGAFVQGSSIEFSADAPMKEPFNVFMQGGLTWNHARLGAALAANSLTA